MKCPICKGCGKVPNPKYFNHSPSWAWEHDIPTSLKCSKCKGSGYIIGNMTDIVERLKVASNGVAITQREARQMYDAIVNYQ